MMRERMASSFSDRRRGERDMDLRRRRHIRHMSQASERSNRMPQTPDLGLLDSPGHPSSSASSSVLINNSAESPESLPCQPFDLTDTSSEPSEEPEAHIAEDRLLFQDPISRTRLNDGRGQIDCQQDAYARNLALIQTQLDTWRALVRRDSSEGARTAAGMMTDYLNAERAGLEADMFDLFRGSGSTDNEAIMSDPDPVMGDFLPFSERQMMTAVSDAPRFFSSSTGRFNSLQQTLSEASAQQLKSTTAFLYSIEPSRAGSDVWPDIHNGKKMPARYVPLQLPGQQRRAWKPEPKRPPFYRNAGNMEAERDLEHIWPMNRLPSEIYYLIAESLSRDDVKSMRLTCKEFEYHTAEIFFKSIVVPFTADVFNMSPEVKVDMKGKGKARAKDQSTGHPGDAFRVHGASIRRFAMSFEVDLDNLVRPPSKETKQVVTAFWGEYQWPYSEYQRFSQLSKLEDAADDTPKMKSAFSYLKNVKELGLSLDGGLGWLSGPDRSIRARILGEQRSVFGTVYKEHDRKRAAHSAFWEYVKEWASEIAQLELKHCTIISRKLTDSPTAFRSLKDQLMCRSELSFPYVDMHEIVDPTARNPQLNLALANILPDGFPGTETQSTLLPSRPTLLESHVVVEQSIAEGAFEGGLVIVKEDTMEMERLETHPLVPVTLSKSQKEWLLETEYAQSAFLSSWIISVMDNRYTLQHVQTLNFARISSRFLPSLSRDDFWNALPQLEKVVLHIIPDLREITKDNVGFVDTNRISPINAHCSVQKLVFNMIANRSNIKALSLGWIDGGEHAQGLAARNKHLMPAIIFPNASLLTVESLVVQPLLEQTMIRLPHVKELALTNCWISPHALVYFVELHPGLESLTLDSVSLTADLTLHPGVNALAAAQVANAPQIPQAPPAGPILQGVGTQNIHVPTQNGVNTIVNNAWLGPHRSGSWPSVLDQISPGRTLAAAGSTTSLRNIPSTTPFSCLASLILKSCGYCRFNNPRLDETAIPPLTYSGGSTFFSKRFTALSRLVSMPRSSIMTEIVQCVPLVEGQALTMGFGLQMGWPDEWASESEALVYDGCLLGGVGRFHGRIGLESRPPPDEDDEMN